MHLETKKKQYIHAENRKKSKPDGQNQHSARCTLTDKGKLPCSIAGNSPHGQPGVPASLALWPLLTILTRAAFLDVSDGANETPSTEERNQRVKSREQRTKQTKARKNDDVGHTMDSG